MGGKEFEQRVLSKTVTGAIEEMSSSSEELYLSTTGGRFHVRWDEGGSTTGMGQLVFLLSFWKLLDLGRWMRAYIHLSQCVTVTDFLGTWLLSILDG